MKITSKLTLAEEDQGPFEPPIAWQIIGDISSAHVLSPVECRYVATFELPSFDEWGQSLRLGSTWPLLCFHLAGMLIILVLWLLVPAKLLPHSGSSPLSLRLLPSPNLPSELIPTEVPAALSSIVEAEQPRAALDAPTMSATAPDVNDEPLKAESSMQPLPGLLQSKAQVLQAWANASAAQYREPEGNYQGHGAVFDARLKSQLSHLEPGRLHAEQGASLLADVNGMQEVIIGDKCFQVTKLDDQALRGMGTWTRGHCQAPDKYKSQLKLGVRP